MESVPLAKVGPLFENHTSFPARINTEFVEVVRADYLKMKVWERGAGATLACGTGACALLVATVLNEKCNRKATVELPGGNLEIEWAKNNRVYMTGPATLVVGGDVYVDAAGRA